MEDLFVEASNLTKRSSYDASIKPKRPIQKLPLNDKFVREFEEEFYKCKADILVDRSLGVLNLNFYICTDSFATRGEQLSLKEADGGVPSLSIGAAVAYETPRGGYENSFRSCGGSNENNGFC